MRDALVLLPLLGLFRRSALLLLLLLPLTTQFAAQTTLDEDTMMTK